MPDYKLVPVYPGLTAVYIDNTCIGVVIPCREWQSEYKRVFFCYSTSFCYYGLTERQAVESYLLSAFEV